MRIQAENERERELQIQEAARYVVQQHARLQDCERALVASHGELDQAREKGHHKVELMLVQFAAAARRAVRHYRRQEDAGVVTLRIALGMGAVATREEIGQAVPEAVSTTSPGIANQPAREDSKDDDGQRTVEPG